MPELKVSGVDMQYTRRSTGEQVLALEQVDITARGGEFVSIVGPSGCGKSTLLGIAAGLLKPTNGSVTVDGMLVTGPGPERAVVFQDASLFPWYTTLRNIAYGLQCRGMGRKEAEELARPFLSLVGLKGFENQYPYELSGGMQQRVNLARALAVDPSVLLMDEPFAALDPQTRELMQVELLEICEKAGKTVLFITHSTSEAIYLSDRVVVFSSRPGRIIEELTIDLPRPRPLAIKRSPQFLQYEEAIWAVLEREVVASMELEDA